MKSVGGISERIAERELDERGSEGGRERVIGRRLKEGWSHYKRYLETQAASQAIPQSLRDKAQKYLRYFAAASIVTGTNLDILSNFVPVTI